MDAWKTKQKALEIAFGSWEESYSYLPIWMINVQHFLLGTIVRYKTSNSMEDGEDDFSKSESKEVWMWFMHHLRRYVTPQPNLCIISDRKTSLLAALQLERVGWTFVYCIHRIASKFNKDFKMLT
ncbi:hypothetical protein HKD37_13G035591 [Glycine soja]